MVDLDSDGPGTSSGRRVRKRVTFWHQTFPGFLSQKIPKSYPNFLRVAGTLGNKYIAYTWFMFITAVGRNIQTKCRKKTARAGWNHTGSHRFSLSYEGLYSTLFSQRWKQKKCMWFNDSVTKNFTSDWVCRHLLTKAYLHPRFLQAGHLHRWSCLYWLNKQSLQFETVQTPKYWPQVNTLSQGEWGDICLYFICSLDFLKRKCRILELLALLLVYFFIFCQTEWCFKLIHRSSSWCALCRWLPSGWWMCYHGYLELDLGNARLFWENQGIVLERWILFTL